MRPGYLADWDEELTNYLKSKYIGWQPSPRTYDRFRSSSRPLVKTNNCPVDYISHYKHGCLPEADIISSKLQI